MVDAIPATWPDDWTRRYFTGRWIDQVGDPVNGSITAKLTVDRAASEATKTTLVKATRTIEVANGIPTGQYTTVNADGVPCILFAITNDTSIVPFGMQIEVTESWNLGPKYYHDLTEAHTLEEPYFITGTLESIKDQPTIVYGNILTFTGNPDNDDEIPAESRVGDWLHWLPSHRITQRLT